MSFIAVEFAKSFVNGRITAHVFTEAYIEIYRIERDNGLLLKDESSVSECLSTIFCLADLYNPAPDKEEYELNDKQLIEQIGQVIKR